MYETRLPRTPGRVTTVPLDKIVFQDTVERKLALRLLRTQLGKTSDSDLLREALSLLFQKYGFDPQAAVHDFEKAAAKIKEVLP